MTARPFMITLGTSAAILAMLALALPAQSLPPVAFRATTLNTLEVRARDSIETLPTNTDVTAGTALSTTSSQWTGSSVLTTAYEPSKISIRLDEVGYSPANSLAATSSVGSNRIVLQFWAARATRARITVRSLSRRDAPFSRYIGRVDILGYGTVVQDGSGLIDIQTFEVVISQHILVVIIDTEGFSGSSPSTDGGFLSDWDLELEPDPDYPCQIESYGDACGATLTATSELLHPDQVVITLEDPSLPGVAALTLGTTRETIPIPGTSCTLYHDLQVFVFPLPIDRNGRLAFVLDPSPFPGASFKLQAATLKGTTLHTTNALDFLVCH